jgi:transposase
MGVTPRQQLLADALVTGLTITAAAKRVGISRKTAHNWLDEPAFQAELHRRRSEIADAVRDDLVTIVAVSVRLIRDFLTDEEKRSIWSDHCGPKVAMAERIVSRMGLFAAVAQPRLASRPRKSGQSRWTDAAPPPLEREGLDPEALAVRDPHDDD